MNKGSIITVVLIIGGLAIAAWTMMAMSSQQSSTAPAASEVSPQAQLLAQCTAYYQISSGTIKRMGVQRMAAVADRLAASGLNTQARLERQIDAAGAQQLIEASKQQLLAQLPSPDQLGPLMQQYREPCQQLVLAGS
ncbi:hypothetical protein [uncultured Ferrimonas sp.]|uniref:hypothetical protein n=1 Tax=uncultured Ferrimonas sp. TaxID=432640 RepID=UPI0026333628|nr:hypothetical protein [uncultured Ferrimonas sp.]